MKEKGLDKIKKERKHIDINKKEKKEKNGMRIKEDWENICMRDFNIYSENNIPSWNKEVNVEQNRKGKK